MSRPYDADQPRPPPHPPPRPAERRGDAAGPPDPAGSSPSAGRGLYILSLSVHGLVRGRDMELGRDADTGGQVAYVVDQARALAAAPGVERVDLVTRRIHDRRVDGSYTEPFEELSPGARIVRLPFGPRRYLLKESLWPHLPSLVDEITRHLRAMGRAPDLVHAHYADAGFVGAQVAKILGVPLLFTGHSLGRVKSARLRESGHTEAALEERYRFGRRIEAEEGTLETAALVLASTRQEVEEQYALYNHYQPARMRVVPPGVDLARFHPPEVRAGAPWDTELSFSMARQLRRFLLDPAKPAVLAMARPDERKNFATLVHAYGRNPELRGQANLILVAGTREDIREMPGGARRTLTDLLLLIDRYDLYGSVAYPKVHEPSDVPGLYRMAAASGGVFINPALTEPFGLTLLEAAASGLPVLATRDGGPRDILEACRNGILIDPRDQEEMGRALLSALDDRDRWTRWAEDGLRGVHESFAWTSHARRYLAAARTVLGQVPTARPEVARRSRLPGVDRVLVANLDHTLYDDPAGLAALLRSLEEAGEGVGLAVTTGRPLPMAVQALDELGAPLPDILVCATGTAIHYGAPLTPDRSWERQIAYAWEPDRVRQVLGGIPGLDVLDDEPPAPFRLRFRRRGPSAPGIQAIRRALRRQGVRVTATLDREVELDVTPVRASPGLAIRFLMFKWDLPPHRVLVAGDSGNDADALEGEMLAVVPGGHSAELEPLRGLPRVYFSPLDHAWGILDGIRHYDFFGAIRIPEISEPEQELTTA